MQTKPQLSFLTLLLLISFASVNAVLFTPALPAIAADFGITDGLAQLTISWYLIGYAAGQLIYGPIANRYGRKPALYVGISLQIISSIICVLAGILHFYTLLIIGRCLLALGAGVGLKMTHTLVNETNEPTEASRKLSYLMIAFAITPGIGVMLGGLLVTHFNWISTFIAGAIYGVILLCMVMKLRETKTNLDYEALKLDHLIQGYTAQFKNRHLVISGLLMGGATCFVYVFAALGPFIAINMLNMSSASYGIANLLPPIGLIAGALCSVRFTTIIGKAQIMQLGLLISLMGSVLMLGFSLLKLSGLITLFIPLMICHFGLALVVANASAIAMQHVTDKAHGSAVMNFINMGSVTVLVLNLGFFPTTTIALPSIYLIITILMLGLFAMLKKSDTATTFAAAQ